MTSLGQRISNFFQGIFEGRKENMESDIKINIISDPSIKLIGHTQVAYDPNGRNQLEEWLKEWTQSKGEKQPYFLNHPTQPDEFEPYDCDNIPEVAGRLCYMSFDKPRPGGNEAYIEHIKETGHGSVLEHTVFNFIACGVSRSLTHELVRHRAGFGYSQLSQRFVDHEPTNEKGQWSFICPIVFLSRPNCYRIWYDHMVASAEAYQALSEEMEKEIKEEKMKVKGNVLTIKQQREAARSVLPNSTETKIFFSVNARALRHLFHMRGSIHADREIRRFTRRVFEEIQRLDVSKTLFADVAITNDSEDVLTVKYPHV